MTSNEFLGLTTQAAEPTTAAEAKGFLTRQSDVTGVSSNSVDQFFVWRGATDSDFYYYTWRGGNFRLQVYKFVPGGATGGQGDAGEGVPAGGDDTQILAKASDADYDTEWVAAPTGGGGGTVTTSDPVSGDGSAGDPVTIANQAIGHLKLGSSVGGVNQAAERILEADGAGDMRWADKGGGSSYTLPQATEAARGGVQGATSAQATGTSGTTILAWTVNRLRQLLAVQLPTVSQPDAEAGTATARSAWTAQRVGQAIAALATGGGGGGGTDDQTAAEVSVDATGYDGTGNLESTDTDVQAVADKVDGLEVLSHHDRGLLVQIPRLGELASDLREKDATRVWEAPANSNHGMAVFTGLVTPTDAEIEAATYVTPLDTLANTTTRILVVKVDLGVHPGDVRVRETGLPGGQVYTISGSLFYLLHSDTLYDYLAHDVRVQNERNFVLEEHELPDGHTEYRGDTIAERVQVDATGFDRILGSTDTDVQTALASINDARVPTDNTLEYNSDNELAVK